MNNTSPRGKNTSAHYAVIIEIMKKMDSSVSTIFELCKHLGHYRTD